MFYPLFPYLKIRHNNASLPGLWLRKNKIICAVSITMDDKFFCKGPVQFSCSVRSNSLRPHGLQHARPPCPSPTPRVYSDSCPLSRWCHPTILSSVIPFSCFQSFPASGSFPMSQLFTSGGQGIGVSASASVPPMNIQDWFSLGWIGWISLQPKGLSRVFPTPQFKSINSSVLSFLYAPTLISIHDYWKNHSLNKMDLCWQSNVSAF